VQAKEIKIKHGELIVNANLNLAPGKSLADGVILMAHGTLAHKDMEIMRALQDLLLERGLNNLAFNYSYAQNDRHGMNDCKGPHRQRIESVFQEISLWVDWLKNNGAKKIIVLGHSRGGNQMAQYVSNFPDPLVKSAILVAPSTWNKGKEIHDYKNRYKKDLSHFLKKAETLILEGRGNILLNDVDFMYCPSTSVSAFTFFDYYKPNPDRDTPFVVNRSKVPVLVITASDDQVVPDISIKMQSHTSTNVRLIIIDDAGHFFRDLVADELADIILKYITIVDK
jgi:pimeloyl-ACP methyl ester carboxylesterase